MQRFCGVLIGTTEQMVDADLGAVLDHIDADPAAASDGRSAASATASAPVPSCARWRGTTTGSVPASACTRRSARPTSPTRRTCSCPTSRGRCTSPSGRRTRCSRPSDNVPFIDAINAMTGGRGEAVVHEGADHGFGVLGSPAYHEERGLEVVREGLRPVRRAPQPGVTRSTSPITISTHVAMTSSRSASTGA